MRAAPQLLEFDDDVERIARRLSRQRESDPRLMGRFGYNELKAEVQEQMAIQLPNRAGDGPLGRLQESGQVVRYPCYERPPGRQNGRMAVYRAVGIDQVTLADVLEECERRIEDTPGSPGRRAPGDREVRSVNRKALERIATALRQTAMRLHPGMSAEDAVAATRGRYLAWDPRAGAHQLGDWRPILEVAEDAERANKVARGRYVGSVRKALDLAATWELIPRTELHGGERARIPTAWAEIQGEWVNAARHPGVAAVLGVNRLLKAIHDVLGSEVEPGSLHLQQAQRVVDHLSAELSADSSLSATRRTSIRRTIRRLRDAQLLPEGLVVNGYDYRQRNRKAAWGNPEVEEIAQQFAAQTREKPAAYSIWEKLPYPGLVRLQLIGHRTVPAPFTLPSVIDFYTVTDDEERTKLGLPFLKAAWPRTQRPRGEAESPSPWNSPSTVASRLDSWALYVGWLERSHPELDWQTLDLREIVKPAFLEEFADSGFTTPGQVARVMITIGLAASPVLERQAVENDDIALADQFFHAACLASGKGKIDRNTGELIGRSLEERASKKHESRREAKNREKFGSARNEAERVELAFLRTLGETHGVEWAYDGYVLLYGAARARVLRSLFGGAESPAKVQQRWDDMYVQPLRQLPPLRRLSLFNFSLGAPIRTAGQTLVDRHMLLHGPNQLRLETPGDIHKYPQNGPYKLLLWEAGQQEGFDIEMTVEATLSQRGQDDDPPSLRLVK